jgi:hypothetical protein
MANDDDKKLAALWKALNELRKEVTALGAVNDDEKGNAAAFEALHRRLDELGAAPVAPLVEHQDGVECPTLPVKQGAIVIYHSELGDFPAIVVRDRIIRAGFPPRYTLFALYDRGGQNTYANFERGVVEGDGMGEFTR